MKEQTSKRISISIPEDLHRGLRMQAASDGRTMSELAVLALRMYLRQAEHAHLADAPSRYWIAKP